MAKLIINPTSSTKREIPLARTLLSIGRDPSNDVVLPDAMVSRRHAVIEFRGSQYVIRDCNSSNGSLVNGDRISERNLKDGDLLAIGTARLLFREAAEVEDVAAKVVQHPSVPKLQCPTCQADYRKGDQFCRQCGAAVAPPPPPQALCIQCQTLIILPANFCNACGASLPKAEGLEVTQPRPVPPEMRGPTPTPPSFAGAPLSPVVPSSASAADDTPPIEKPRPPEVSEARPVPGAPRVTEAMPLRRTPEAVARVSAPAWPEARPAGKTRPAVPRPLDSAAVRSGGQPAGFLVRGAAGALDMLLVGAGQAILLSPALYYFYRWFQESRITPTEAGFVPIVLSLLLGLLATAMGILYFVYFWGTQGATPGKKMFGLRVESLSGVSPIGVSPAFIRLVGYGLSAAFLGFGFLMIAFGGAGLHDRLASTRVVRKAS